MSDPTTPYQKVSDTSRKAAEEKDATGTTLDQDEILLAFFQERGAQGVYIFEAAEHLTARLGYEVVPGTASGRINDLMKDEKCQRWFGCNALVKKSKKLPRKDNPKSGKSAGAYVLKSFEPDDDDAQTPSTPPEVREAGAASATATPAAAAPVIIETLPENESQFRDRFLGEYPPVHVGVDLASKPDVTAAVIVDGAGNVHEAPDEFLKELAETSAGRSLAHAVVGGRQQGKTEAMRRLRDAQGDFGFGPQLRPVR